MLPEIEIWDLDVMNAIEPAFILGSYFQNNNISLYLLFRRGRRRKKG